MKKLFAFTILFLISNSYAQTAYKFRGEFGEAQQKEVLKSADSLFYYLPNITLNVSTNHLSAYKDIPKDKSYQPGYLEEQEKRLNEHPGDAYAHNNMALYYQSKGDYSNAQEHYTKALQNLKMQPADKDSASYYSFRAMIKLNLGQDGITDMERALAINKSDSISLVFYPLFLAGKGDYPKAKSVVVAALNDKENKMKDFSYLMLGVVEVYGVTASLLGMSDADTDTFIQQDISKIIDFDALDKYMDAKNPVLVRAKQMLGLFNGIFKYSPGLEPGGTFTPDKDDIAYMEAKEQFFKKALKEKNGNVYGAYFSLGIISYAQKKFPEALGYFEKALAAFPKDKEGFQFNTAEIYDNMAGIYYMTKELDKAREMLSKKLALKSPSVTVRKEAHLGIAGIYIEQGKLSEAETHALAALEIEDSFAANSMLAYISFKRNYSLSAEKYLQKAMAQIGNEDDLCRIMTFVAAIQMHNGSPDGAYAVYNDHKSYLGDYECDCDELLSRYVVESK